MQVDVTNLIVEMLDEAEERKQRKNVDLLFRVCIPLYFLSDVSEPRGNEPELIKQLLLNKSYQMLIRQRLGSDTSSVFLAQVMARFIQNPNDLSNNRELSQIEKTYSTRTEFFALSSSFGGGCPALNNSEQSVKLRKSASKILKTESACPSVQNTLTDIALSQIIAPIIEFKLKPNPLQLQHAQSCEQPQVTPILRDTNEDFNFQGSFNPRTMTVHE